MQQVRSNPVATFVRLTAEQRWLLLRAVLLLSAASAFVALLPFKRALAFGSTRARRNTAVDVDEHVWAVQAAAKRLPWRTMCIEQGLTLQRMLRGAGVGALLHYGASRGVGPEVEAHVWVSVGGEVVMGGEEAQRFAEIATYPLAAGDL